jgi:hypothetical protein
MVLLSIYLIKGIYFSNDIGSDVVYNILTGIKISTTIMSKISW